MVMNSADDINELIVMLKSVDAWTFLKSHKEQLVYPIRYDNRIKLISNIVMTYSNIGDQQEQNT